MSKKYFLAVVLILLMATTFLLPLATARAELARETSSNSNGIVQAATRTPTPTRTPNVTNTPRPTNTPSLRGTSGPAPTAVFIPPAGLGGDVSSLVNGGEESGIYLFDDHMEKGLLWYGFPGPVVGLGGQDGSYLYVKNHADRPTIRAQWPITVGQSGYYDVYVHIPPVENATSAATYRVFHNNELGPEAVVDQAAKSDLWVILGTFYFNTGAGQFVYVDNHNDTEGTATRYVLLDAISLVFRP